MRVLMLGWEFPPFITGGLGTACYGLTKALDRRAVDVLFALPKSVTDETASHVRLLSPPTAPLPATSAPGALSPPEAPEHRQSQSQAPPTAPTDIPEPAETRPKPAESTPPPAAPATPAPESPPEPRAHIEFENVTFLDIPIEVSGAYARPGSGPVVRMDQSSGTDRRAQHAVGRGLFPGAESASSPAAPDAASEMPTVPFAERQILQRVMPEKPPRAEPRSTGPEGGPDYAGDLMSQVQQYARFALRACAGESFDVIHAHDWLTYPAGLAVKQVTGKPLVVHVHSTEFDRSGPSVNQPVYDIERRGMHGADAVITVSQWTKNIVVSRYGVSSEKAEVVYNGVELDPTQPDNIGIERRDKIVLYFGRITQQKGPEYFLRAARRVLEYMDDVKFVVAGSGDMAAHMIEAAASMGIGDKVLFTGFLRGRDIKRVFALADLYVMPSVSEPFGIAPLEAMSNDVPVIISKSSGVSEVLSHVLKVDFWDTDDMANKIIAVLRHPPLSRTLREHGAFEVRRLTWDGAAERCEQVYRRMLGERAESSPIG